MHDGDGRNVMLTRAGWPERGGRGEYTHDGGGRAHVARAASALELRCREGRRCGGERSEGAQASDSEERFGGGGASHGREGTGHVGWQWSGPRGKASWVKREASHWVSVGRRRNEPGCECKWAEIKVVAY